MPPKIILQTHLAAFGLLGPLSLCEFNLPLIHFMGIVSPDKCIFVWSLCYMLSKLVFLVYDRKI